MEQLPEQEYTPKEVSQLLEIDSELLKKWANEFDIQTIKTTGGHRRYSKKNIEELKAIKEKIREHKWSWKQVKQWRNGEEEAFVEHEEKSSLEKKLDLALEELKEHREFRELSEKYFKQQQELTKQLIQEINDNRKQLHALQGYINGQLDVRDKQIEEKITSLPEKKKRKGFFSIFQR